MTNNFVQKPEPWQTKVEYCRSCEEGTDYQFLYHRNEWVCLECGKAWVSDEELVKIREVLASLTPADIWGGD